MIGTISAVDDGGTNKKSDDKTNDSLRMSLECSIDDWTRIKSNGRQGVRRAYQQGGIRKAKIKLDKMIRAADGATSSSNRIGDHLQQQQSYREKKRRKRQNIQQREEANDAGHLTLPQLYQLFANERTNWERLNKWLTSMKLAMSNARGGRQLSKLKFDKKRQWKEEYDLFQNEFANQIGNAIQPLTSAQQQQIQEESAVSTEILSLFISTVSPILRSPPNETEAQRLWQILDEQHQTGMTVGSTNVPLSSTNNIGAKMLLALGWKPGTGLGKKSQGICEPIEVISQQHSLLGVGGTTKRKTAHNQYNRFQHGLGFKRSESSNKNRSRGKRRKLL